MKSLGRRLLACCLTVPLILSSQIMGYAEDVEVSTIGDYSMSVNAYRPSDFLVSIPKSADLSNGTSQYKVKVKGDIAANDSIIVEPDNSFIMTSDSGSAAVANVIQNKIEWASNEITGDDFVETTGDITCNIGVGTWSGQLHFNIRKGASTGGSTDIKDYNIQDMYFGNAVITVKDGDILYVDGVQVTLTNNSYTITDKGTHKIIIISQDGSGVSKDIVIVESNLNGVSSVKKPNGDYELSFTPDSGKVIESVTVNGTTVDVTATGDGSYSFIINGSTDLSNITININVKYDMPEASQDDYFTFELNSAGTEYIITSISAEGKNQRLLSFPSEHQGLPVGVLGKSTGSNNLLTRNDTNVKELYIPNSVHTISSNCFSESKVSKVIMTDSVKSIGANAFKECTSLEELHLSGTSITINDSAFDFCPYLDDISLNYSESITLGINSFRTVSYSSSPSSNYITIGDLNSDADFKFSTPVLKAERPFGFNTHITKYEIPSSVKELGGLLSYSDVTNVDLPNTVTKLGDSAYEGCTQLTSIVVPDNIDSLGVSVFSGCTNLTSVELPNSIIILGNSAFEKCTSLTSIELPSSITTMGISIFKDCTSLTNVNMFDGLSSIGDYTFQGCTGLVNIIIPDSVSIIGKYAFKDCTGLRSLILPKNLTEIPEGLVRDCSALKYVYIYGNPEFDKYEISKYVSGTGLVVDKTRAPFYGVYYGSFPDSSCTLYFELSDNTTFIGLDKYDQIAISSSEKANTEYGVTLEQFKTAAGL